MTFAHGGDVERVAREADPVDRLLDFSANINPMGLPPRAAERLAREAGDPRFWSRYPDPQAPGTAHRALPIPGGGARIHRARCGCGLADPRRCARLGAQSMPHPGARVLRVRRAAEALAAKSSALPRNSPRWLLRAAHRAPGGRLRRCHPRAFDCARVRRHFPGVCPAGCKREAGRGRGERRFCRCCPGRSRSGRRPGDVVVVGNPRVPRRLLPAGRNPASASLPPARSEPPSWWTKPSSITLPSPPLPAKRP